MSKMPRREYLEYLGKLLVGTTAGIAGGYVVYFLENLEEHPSKEQQAITSFITETEYLEKLVTIHETETKTFTETYVYVPRPKPIVRSLIPDNSQLKYRIWNRHDTDTGVFALMGAEISAYKFDELIVKGYNSFKDGEKWIIDRLAYDYSVITLEDDSVTHAFHPTDVIENNMRRSREHMVAAAIEYFKNMGIKHIHLIGYSGGGSAIAEQIKGINRIESVTWINVPFELNFENVESPVLFKQLSKGKLIEYIDFPNLVVCGDLQRMKDERLGYQIYDSSVKFFTEIMNNENISEEVKLKSKLKILEGFGHDINVDNGPQMIVEIFNNFIRNLY